MKRESICVLLYFLLSQASIVSFCSASNELPVDVKFEIITGYGLDDYYVGDNFWYNITLTNSGNTVLNTTFYVKVLNTTGSVMELIKEYSVFLTPNETAFLYPYYTSSSREIVNIYWFNAPGTYTIEVSSDMTLTYYRYYASGRYTFEPGKCKYSFDVMPSYQKVQNERWSQFLEKNEEYMDLVEQSISESRIEANKIRNLTIVSLCTSIISTVLTFLAIPNKERNLSTIFLIVFFSSIFIIFFLLFG